MPLGGMNSRGVVCRLCASRATQVALANMEVEPLPQPELAQLEAPQQEPAGAAVEAEPEQMLLIVSRVMAGARWKREHTRERRDELKQAAKAARVDEVRADGRARYL